MRHGLFLLAWFLCHASQVFSQQLLCERELRTNAPSYVQAVTLLRLRQDTLRLVSDNLLPLVARPLRTRVQRLNAAGCDTLPAGPAVVRVANPYSAKSLACANRRGQVLVAVQLTGGRTFTNRDSLRFGMQLFNRDGTLRWFRAIRPQTESEGATSLIEAPGNGFFIIGGQTNGRGGSNTFLLRLDSLGQVQWRRVYSRTGSYDYGHLVYTRSGTLLATLKYAALTPARAPATAVAEFNQQGDSLTTRRVLLDPQQLTWPTSASGSLLPLQDGGFALVGVVDSANTSYGRPFLARLDRNLNLVWSHLHRQRLATAFAQPQELADGSLVVVASNGQSGRGFPFWLFRFSASGAWLQRYPFISQALTPYNAAGRYGFFGVAQGLQSLSDSTLVVAAGFADLNSSRVYLAHLRVPGLPRVVDSHVVPAAQPLAARPGRAAGASLELYPNPASETLTVRHAPAPGTAPAALKLRDALGRVVLTQPLPHIDTGEVRVSVQHLPPGLYVGTVEAAGQLRASRKVSIVR
ncbi:MAG TPA: T9SS type A sorting domain-containing protein [Hymenobacter sp.]|uniref:T9SS type A sorting domain-containing protein n=1 Tax=Hymenobacter sp. TaxID=1898978 RepID=UPI002ED8A471